MPQPYLGEIRLMSFNFPPKNWAVCNGQFLPINQNQALFSLLGTIYGGNGVTTFALPNLQGRVAMHEGQTPLGSVGGVEAVALNQTQIPRHTHVLQAAGAASTAAPGGSHLATPAFSLYDRAANSSLAPQSVQTVGQSLPHENMQPYAVISFCISLVGVFPSRN